MEAEGRSPVGYTRDFYEVTPGRCLALIKAGIRQLKEHIQHNEAIGIDVQRRITVKPYIDYVRGVVERWQQLCRERRQSGGDTPSPTTTTTPS